MILAYNYKDIEKRIKENPNSVSRAELDAYIGAAKSGGGQSTKASAPVTSTVKSGSTSSSSGSSSKGFLSTVSSILSPRKDITPESRPYSDKQYLTNTEKEVVKQYDENTPWSEETKTTARSRIDTKLQKGENVSNEELDFYLGKTEKIMPKTQTKQEKADYYDSKNANDLIQAQDAISQSLKEAEVGTDDKRGITMYSGGLSEDDLKKAQKDYKYMEDTVIWGKEMTDAGWSDDQKYQYLEAMEKYQPDKKYFMFRYKDQWLKTSVEEAKKLTEPKLFNLEAAKFKMSNDALGTLGDGAGEVFSRAMANLDAGGSAVRNTWYAKNEGQSWKDSLLKGLDGAVKSVDGTYAFNPEENVYGKDILEQYGADKDKFGTKAGGFLIDVLASPNITGGVTKGVVGKGGTALGKLGTKELAAVEKTLLAKAAPKTVAEKAVFDDVLKQLQTASKTQKGTARTAGNTLSDSVQAEIGKADDLAHQSALDAYSKQYPSLADQILKEQAENTGSRVYKLGEGWVDSSADDLFRKANPLDEVGKGADEFADFMERPSAPVKGTAAVDSANNYRQKLISALDNGVQRQTGLQFDLPIPFTKNIELPKGISNVAAKGLDKLTDNALTRAVFASKGGQAAFNAIDNVAAKFNRKWMVDPRVIKTVNAIQGKTNVEKADYERLIKETFKDTTEAEREAMTDYLAGLNPTINKQNLGDFAREEFDRMFQIEGLPDSSYRSNYVPTFLSKYSKKSLTDAADKTVTQANALKAMGVDVPMNLNVSTFNPSSIQKIYDNPQAYNETTKGASKAITDIADILLKRGHQSTDVVSKQNLVNELKKMGLKTDVDDAGNIVFPFGSVDGVNQQTIKYVNDALKRTNPDQQGLLYKGIKGLNNQWKTRIMNFPLFPGTAARSLYGGAMTNYEEMGLTDMIKAYVKAMTAGKTGVRTAEGIKLSPDDYGRLAAENKVSDGMWQRDMANPNDAYRNIGVDERNIISKASTGALNPLSKNFALFKLGAKINGGIDNLNRNAHFINSISKNGITDDALSNAARDLEKAHFNYNADESLTATERKIKDTLVPFYTFQRFNLPYQLEKMVTNPEKIRRVDALQRAINDEEGDVRNDPYFPEYLKNAIHIGQKNGNETYVNPSFSPIQDVKEYGNLPGKLGSLSPLLKTAYNLSLGKSDLLPQTMQDKALGSGFDLGGTRTPMLGAEQIYDTLGANWAERLTGLYKDSDGTLRQRADLQTAIKDLSPIFSRADSLYQAQGKDDRAEANGLEGGNFTTKLAQLMGGIGVSTVDLDQQKGFQMDRDLRQMKDYMKTLQDQGRGVNYNPDYNSDKPADYQIEQNWADETDWYDKYADKEKTFTWSRSSDGGVRDMFGNLIDYIPRTKAQLNPAKIAEMEEKMATGKVKSQEDYKRYLAWKEQGGVPKLKDFYTYYGVEYNAGK